LGEISTMPPPTPLRVREPSKYMLQCSRVTGKGSCCASVHSATKSKAHGEELKRKWKEGNKEMG
jgi:hypothetical protein